MPEATLVAPVTVAVYIVPGASVVPDVRVNVAIVPVAFKATLPLGLTQGALQVTVKLAVPVIGFIGALKAAVITVLLTATPVALLTGATAVTVGATATGTTTPPPLPRIGLWPPPPLQPAMKMVSKMASMCGNSRRGRFGLFIFVSGYLKQDFVSTPDLKLAAMDTTTFHRVALVEKTARVSASTRLHSVR